MRRGAGGDRRFRAGRARRRRGGGGHGHARLHAPPAGAAGHARLAPARLGGDARPRPRPVRARGRAGAASRRSARARSPARRCRCRPVGAMRNTLDAVADRDFALDYLYAAAVLFVHLSRIGEELVLWSSSEFGFARLPEEAATGSSMMPQKLNPDVAELARGKAGTAIGRLTGLLATVKGLPLAYNRDLQEDKRPVFDARRDVREALAALAVLVGGLAVRPRAAGRRRGRPAAPRDRRRRGARRRGRPVPRRARAGRRARCGRARSIPDSTAAESVAARLGDVRAAVAAARARFQAAVGERLGQAEAAGPDRAADDGAFAAEVAERARGRRATRSRRRRAPVGRPRAPRREAPGRARRASRRGACS